MLFLVTTAKDGFVPVAFAIIDWFAIEKHLTVDMVSNAALTDPKLTVQF